MFADDLHNIVPLIAIMVDLNNRESIKSRIAVTTNNLKITLASYNESTAGADASVEALKLYDMKLLP